MEDYQKRVDDVAIGKITKLLSQNERSILGNIRFAIKHSDHSYVENKDVYRVVYKTPLGDYSPKRTEYIYKNEYGEKIQYVEDTKTHSYTFKFKNAEIEMENGLARYYLNLRTGRILLAEISDDKALFPQYGENEPLKVIGKLPLEEVKATVMDTINESIRNHPIMGKYADMILGDFNTILSLDKERDIIPVPEEEKAMASLKRINAELEAKKAELETENSQQKSIIEFLMEKIKGIPIFGKKILASLSKMLPAGKKGEHSKDIQAVSTGSKDTKAFVPHVDVPGIAGIVNNGKEGNEQTQQDKTK